MVLVFTSQFSLKKGAPGPPAGVESPMWSGGSVNYHLAHWKRFSWRYFVLLLRKGFVFSPELNYLVDVCPWRAEVGLGGCSSGATYLGSHPIG